MTSPVIPPSAASIALSAAADALETQLPMLRAQYVATLRLYAAEPWRLTTCPSECAAGHPGAEHGATKVIPAQAVEAAERAAGCVFGNPVSADEMEGIIKILEAAAPHMLAEVTTKGELDALPLNSVILDREGLPLHKDDSDRIEEWCYGDNAVDVMLPAIVLWEPRL